MPNRLIESLIVIGALVTSVSLVHGDRSDPTALKANVYDSKFWSHWGDGNAELAGYDLIFPRYGEKRQGTAVAIFVNEPFSESARVKADRGKHPPRDEFQVMKLNLVRDFPTGIYDYNLMTSVFVGLQPSGGRPAGAVTKVSFSSQEWCGQVYQQLLFDRASIRQTVHSYFDGEGDQESSISANPSAISEDALMLWARGLAAPFIEPGETRNAPMIRSLTSSRLEHKALDSRTASLHRGDRATITVPAGTFETELRTAAIEGGVTWTFWVETVTPHRVIRWESTAGESAELIRSVRVPYWKMNGTKFEAAVDELGLRRRPGRTM